MKKKSLGLFSLVMLLSIAIVGCSTPSSDIINDNDSKDSISNQSSIVNSNVENNSIGIDSEDEDSIPESVDPGNENSGNTVGTIGAIQEKTSIWDGTVEFGFGGGSGSPIDPYRINDASQLAYLSECCKKGVKLNGNCFRLECNINLNGLEWYPIGQHVVSLTGDDTHGFKGEFDGQGYSVSNFQINVDVINKGDGDLNVGLFGYIKTGYIHDLTVKNFSFNDNGQWAYVGGLIGRVDESTCVNNCHVQNGVIKVVAGEAKVGGLIGYIEGGERRYVANCSADTKITVECSLYNSKTEIKDGKEFYTANMSFLVGGLIGEAYYIPVYNCFSTGEVSGAMITDGNKFDGDFIGGLIGFSSFSDVYSSYSTATVISYETEDEGYIGGLIGLAGGDVFDSYSAGKVTCSSPGFDCGGLIGGTFDSVSNCFSATDIYADGSDMSCDLLLGKVEGNNTRVINCYVSNDAVLDNNSYYKTPNITTTVVTDTDLKNTTFLCEDVGFTLYDKASAYSEDYFSGWILTDGTFPKLYFEDAIKPKAVKLDKDLTKYIGLTSKDLTNMLGYDYMSIRGSLYYPQAEATFLLNNYQGSLGDNETIVAIRFTGNRDLGNNIRANISFDELYSLFGDKITEPTYLGIEEIYFTSITINNIIYEFAWGSYNDSSDACSDVTIYCAPPF